MRRKSEEQSKPLSHLARFLRHACEQKGISQSDLTQRISSVSTATVSRWFSDRLAPREDDLKPLGRALGVPAETLRALRILDAFGDTPAFATSGLYYHLARGRASTLLLAGLTLAGAMYFFREVRLTGKTLLLSLVDPTDSKLVDYETENSGWQSGNMRVAWLTSVSVAAEAYETSPRPARVRLWVRSSLPVYVDGPAQLAANDWVGLATKEVANRQRRSLVVPFFGDEYWTKYVDPLVSQLKASDGPVGAHTLLWDSAWSADDPRYKKLRDAMMKIQNMMDLPSIFRPLGKKT